MRFPIRRDPLWRPLLVLFGATAGRSWLEIDRNLLVARFGWLFRREFRLAEVESAQARGWPLLLGIGWRLTYRGTMGLIGSRAGVVEVAFRRRYRSWPLLPVPFRRLDVSLEDPDSFLQALAEARTAAGGPGPA